MTNENQEQIILELLDDIRCLKDRNFYLTQQNVKLRKQLEDHGIKPVGLSAQDFKEWIGNAAKTEMLRRGYLDKEDQN